MCYLSLIIWNMLLFCRRMCLQLVLLGSNCFLSTSFCKQGYPFSPRCYCDLLVNCTNHFFLKSVLCSSAKMSHEQHFYISVGLRKGRLVLLSSSSNSVPNLLQQVVSPKERSRRWSASICVCYVSSSSSTIIVIKLTGYLCKQGWSARF